MHFSFVMAAFNASATIEDALNSLLQQRTEYPYEIVVIDDGSTDDTAALIRGFNNPRVKAIYLRTNVGRAEARNIAIREATGDIIVIADADDVALPSRLEEHARAFAADSSIAVHGGQLHDLVGNATCQSTLRFPTTVAAVDQAFQSGRMGIAHPASAFRRSWFSNTGGYDPALRWAEDYELFARGWRPELYQAVSAPLIAYRRESSATSWKYWWENARHTRAINDRLSLKRQGKSIPPFAALLQDRSGPSQVLTEGVHYLIYRTVGLLFSLRKSVSDDGSLSLTENDSRRNVTFDHGSRSDQA